MPVVLHGSGLTRSLAFDYAKPGQMISSSARVCGFVPMRGTAAAQGSRTIRLAGDVTLSLDRTDPADDNELAQALNYPAHRHWTGITVGDREAVAHLDLWLATNGGRFARMSAGQHARDSQLADPALRWAGAALHDGMAIAYLTARPAAPSGQSELGIVTHGPRSTQLADDTAALLHQWSRSRPAQPRITAQPAGTIGNHAPPGFRISRPQPTDYQLVPGRPRPLDPPGLNPHEARKVRRPDGQAVQQTASGKSQALVPPDPAGQATMPAARTASPGSANSLPGRPGNRGVPVASSPGPQPRRPDLERLRVPAQARDLCRRQALLFAGRAA